MGFVEGGKPFKARWKGDGFSIDNPKEGGEGKKNGARNQF